MKNIKISSENKLVIDPDLIYYNFHNLDKSKQKVFYETENNYIQFHFCIGGHVSFQYNNGAYSFPVGKGNSILLYNQIMNLPVNAILDINTKLVSVLVKIEKLHGLFSEDAETIPFLSDEHINKKYYKAVSYTHLTLPTKA